ncbi:MAG: RusA family crossover junction endodeoxyribonuclease [Polynucleobacter sp.]|jgi:Holliday junction resolvase RusA-like endonuclease
MTFMVTFMVEGTPVPKGRPRFARRGKFVSTYSPKTTVDYESKVSESAKLAMGASEPLETPVGAYIYITLPVPASYSKKRTQACLSGQERPTKKSDIDNYCKAIFDGMNGIVFVDDSLIVSLHATKVYGTVGMVEVMIKEDLD